MTNKSPEEQHQEWVERRTIDLAIGLLQQVMWTTPNDTYLRVMRNARPEVYSNSDGESWIGFALEEFTPTSSFSKVKTIESVGRTFENEADHEADVAWSERHKNNPPRTEE